MRYCLQIISPKSIQYTIATFSAAILFLPFAIAEDLETDTELYRKSIAAINAHDYKLAIDCRKKIIDLRRQKATGHYEGETRDLCDLSRAYLRNNQPGLAETYFKESISLLTEAQKSIPFCIDDALFGLADCQDRLRKLAEEKETLLKTISLPRAQVWSEQLNVVVALRTLSDIYITENNYREAINARERMFFIESETFDKRDPTALDFFGLQDLTKLGLLYEKVNNKEAAIRTYKRAISELDKRVLWRKKFQVTTKNSAQEADCLILLGNLLLIDKKYQEAFALYDRATNIYLNVDSTSTAYSKFIGTSWLDSYLKLAKKLKNQNIDQKKSNVDSVRAIILLHNPTPNLEGFD